MNLFSLLDESTVLPHFEVGSKKELINALVDSLKDKIETEESLEEVREAVFEREEIMSTGVGKGLAIPHAKTKAVDTNLAVFALLKESLDFDSIDKEPVRLVFLLVGPESNNSQHIKLLSRISRLMNSGSFREKILNCTTTEEILEAFREEEEKYFVS
ncbi:PTS sugar transporter subunit IIA [Gracilimonas mengyeensis]|uniref:PTS system IIA component, Fru family n=1 Tax=Gracilimonas mengyeensis TaxID=1302730 RepID=A0A521AAM2_9BACT|nr:PTS sugar transporter subunit IIA [Gracilimonas mengyeensis]SMO31836.1 PTS system IIA component, Fru family [Gracilimonas mengyeensis]